VVGGLLIETRRLIMLSHRLIGLIETHSEQIIRRLSNATQLDSRLEHIRKLPGSEIFRRFEDVCRHLGQWLATSDEQALHHRYENLGRERCEEGIPLHEVVCMAQLFERELVNYAREHAEERTAVELYAEGELERLLRSFFDKVIFHLVRGYERALLESRAPRAAATR
jgi:hypothetical protein